MDDLTETKISSEVIHDAGFIKLVKDQVELPDGNQAERYVVEHCGAVAIIPITKEGEIILVRQYRYSIKQESIEIPAGKLDENEDHLVCAKRELLEETGYASDNWNYLLTTHTSIGFSNEKLKMFVAKDVKQVAEVNTDPGEFVEPIKLTLAQAIEKINNGEITENRTQLALIWLLNICKQKCIGLNLKKL